MGDRVVMALVDMGPSLRLSGVLWLKEEEEEPASKAPTMVPA